MAIDRNRWSTYHDPSDLPQLPCPNCQKGTLLSANDTVKELKPAHIVKDEQNREWEPDWSICSWSETVKCSNKSCGHYVHMSGKYSAEHAPYEDDDGFEAYGWQSYVKIIAVYPAPHIIQLSKKFPKRLASIIKSSFPLYWSDHSACINRLRTAMEVLLDEQKIPRVKTVNGKNRRQNLDQRIKAFAKTNGLSEYLDGLRNIGNLATHDYDKVTAQETLDVYDVISHVLRELYELDDILDDIKAKAAKLKSKKH